MSRIFKLALEEVQEQNTETIKPEDQKTSTDFSIENNEIEEVVAQELLKIDIQELEEEIQYNEDVSAGITGLRTITERIPNPTPTDVALVRVAANMAVAGTETDAENVIPAIESNKPFDAKSFDKKIVAIEKHTTLLKNELANLKAKQKIAKEELDETIPSEEKPEDEINSIATENWEKHLQNKLAVIKKLQSEIPHLKKKIAEEKAKKKKK